MHPDDARLSFIEEALVDAIVRALWRQHERARAAVPPTMPPLCDKDEENKCNER